MRRRRPEFESGPAAALTDPATWPPCVRADGGVQPCLCWFSRQLDDIPDEQWPGGDEGKFRDWLELTHRHECWAPFDPSSI